MFWSTSPGTRRHSRYVAFSCSAKFLNELLQPFFRMFNTLHLIKGSLMLLLYIKINTSFSMQHHSVSFMSVCLDLII